MKKCVIFILILACVALLAAGCGRNTDSGRLKVVATVFPVYDWTREVAGENVEPTLLLDNGVDLHSFQPTVDDLILISECDVFIYVGGESDAWVEKALENPKNERRIVVDLLDLLGERAMEETELEGMQSEHEEDRGNGDEKELDEHIWLSLRNASFLCPKIADALAKADPERADVYAKNAAAYAEKLGSLDKKYTDIFADRTQNALIIADRFPFSYLVADYGFMAYAAFSGCSAETEASTDTVIFLANKVNETNSGTIFYLESSDGSVAKTVRDATKTKDQSLVALDSLQSVNAKKIADGATYLSAMEKTLSAIAEAVVGAARAEVMSLR